MSPKPTREEVKRWKYESAYSPLHDHAFENHNRLICLADAYLSQEEEEDKPRSGFQRTIDELSRTIDLLQAENQALKAEVGAIIQAIKDEPELPGPMPDGMLNDIEKAGIEETMRVVVRETKRGILRRINL